MILKEDKNFGCTRFSIFQENIWKTELTDTLAKTSQNIYAYSFVKEHSKPFSLFLEEKTCSFKRGGGVDPLSPLADASAKNASFFYVLP